MVGNVPSLVLLALASSISSASAVDYNAAAEFSNFYYPLAYPLNFEKFNETELAALAELEEKQLAMYEQDLEEGKFLSEWSGGCGCADGDRLSCGCCTGVKVIWKHHEACLNISVEPHRLALVLSMDFNKNTILALDIAPTELCAFLPFWWPFNKIQLCVVAYDLHINALARGDAVEDTDFRICLQLDLVIFTPVFTVDFNCLIVDDGEVWIDNSITTYRPGIIALNINKGNPKLSFNNPFNIKNGLELALPTVHAGKIKGNIERTLSKIKKIKNLS